jgi:hypothetical protein
MTSHVRRRGAFLDSKQSVEFQIVWNYVVGTFLFLNFLTGKHTIRWPLLSGAVAGRYLLVGSVYLLTATTRVAQQVIAQTLSRKTC